MSPERENRDLTPLSRVLLSILAALPDLVLELLLAPVFALHLINPAAGGGIRLPPEQRAVGSRDHRFGLLIRPARRTIVIAVAVSIAVLILIAVLIPIAIMVPIAVTIAIASGGAAHADRRDPVVPFLTDIAHVASELAGAAVEPAVLVNRDLHMAERPDRRDLVVHAVGHHRHVLTGVGAEVLAVEVPVAIEAGAVSRHRWPSPARLRVRARRRQEGDHADDAADDRPSAHALTSGRNYCTGCRYGSAHARPGMVPAAGTYSQPIQPL